MISLIRAAATLVVDLGVLVAILVVDEVTSRKGKWR